MAPPDELSPDERLREETQMPAHLAESPLTCVAVGSGRAAIWTSFLPVSLRAASAAAWRILVWYAGLATLVLGVALVVDWDGALVAALIVLFAGARTIARRQKSRVPVPYGLAISVAGMPSAGASPSRGGRSPRPLRPRRRTPARRTSRRLRAPLRRRCCSRAFS